jgi:hypothetical protein
MTELGARQIIDTLTQIDNDIVKDKFYTIDNIPDYVDTELGVKPYVDIIKQSETKGKNFFTDEDLTTNIQEAFDSQRIAARKDVEVGLYELETIRHTQNYDLVTEKLSARKKNYDLDLQKITFLGNGAEIKGLFTLDNINVDTTIITTPLGQMTPDEIRTIAASLYNAFRTNSNFTSKPNRFLLPTSDFLDCCAGNDASFALAVGKTRLDYLQECFIKATENTDFKILKIAYPDFTQQFQGQYLLYNKDPKVLVNDLPIEFKVVQISDYNNLTWRSESYSQVGGIRLKRPKEFMKFSII